MMNKREDLKGELLVMKICSCVCFLESMIQEHKKLKEKKQREGEVNAGMREKLRFGGDGVK